MSLQRSIHPLWQRGTTLIVVGTLSLLASTGCGPKETAVVPPTATSPEAIAPSPAAVPADAGNAEGQTTGLVAVVAKTKTAVDAGDAAKAKMEFEQFEAAWKPIEDGIKEKTPEAYEAIEKSMDEVVSQLGAAPLDKTKALAALSALDGAIAKAK